MNSFYNAPLLAAMAAWLAAQVVKLLLYLIKNRKISVERLWGAGGMPSSHSAAVCALAASIAKTEGGTSAVFGVAAILALIVMYDASGVRRAAGMHAREINQIKDIIEELEAAKGPAKDGTAGLGNIGEINKENIEEKKEQLKEFIGHSPFEVFLGAALGIIVGVFIPWF